MVKALAFLALSLPLLAQQSAIMNGTTQRFSNATSTVRSGDYRIEYRVHNFAPTQMFGDYVFDLNWIGSYATLETDGDVTCASLRDSMTPLPIGTNFASGKTDLIVRIQRVAAENRIYCEVWEPGTTAYAKLERAITGSAPWANGSNVNSAIGTNVVASGNSYYTGRIDYLRVFSTTLPLGSKPSWQNTTLGDLASWELEGDATARLTDSSGLGKTLTASGTPTYAASLTGSPVSSPRGDNTTIFSQAPMKAGQSNTLGNWSICRNNSPCASYFWTQTGGPSTLTWSSRTTATPTVTGAVATTGTDYTLRLVTTDTSGVPATTDLALGAVAVDANDIVILTSAVERNILGSMIRFGSNPWTFQDFNQAQFSDVYIDRLATNYAYQNYWDTPAPGTVSVNLSSSAVTGSSTTFQTTFSCAPGVANLANVAAGTELTWVSGPTYHSGLVNAQIIVDGYTRSIIAYTDSTHITVNGYFGTLTGKATQIQENITFWYPHVDGSSGRADFYVSTCSSNTALTITGGNVGNTWPKANLVAATYSRSATKYAWNSDGPNFYDPVKGMWAMYRRSGLSKYKNASRQMAQIFYFQPYWDMQEWACGTLGEYRFPQAQAAAGLWLHYHDDNTIFGANFPARMGCVTTDQIARLVGYMDRTNDARETSYAMQAAQYVANWHPTEANRLAAQAFVDTLISTTFPGSVGPTGAIPTVGTPPASPTFTVTNGSAIATATGVAIPSDFCSIPAYAAGTVSFTGGSYIMTGSGTTFDSTMLYKQIEVYDSGLTGPDRTWRSFVVSVDSATQITMGHPYNGSNLSGRSYGIYSYINEADTPNTDNYKQVLFMAAMHNTDTTAYTCTRNSDTQITLTRTYEGTSGSGKLAQTTTFNGAGYQPLTNNIALDAMTTVTQYAGATTAAGAAALRVSILDFLQRDGDGYIAAYKGASYWPNAPRCGSDVTKDLACSGYFVSSKGGNRDFMLDGIAPVAAAYLAAPTVGRKAIADEYYTAAWAANGYVSPVAGDGETASIMLYNSFNYGNGKAYGQPYGVGNSSAWPAARLGGIAPLATATKSIKARLADVSGATDIVVDFQAADGTVSTSSACTSAACTFSADTRQGYRYRVRYRNGGATTIAQGEYTPVQ